MSAEREWFWDLEEIRELEETANLFKDIEPELTEEQEDIRNGWYGVYKPENMVSWKKKRWRPVGSADINRRMKPISQFSTEQRKQAKQWAKERFEREQQMILESNSKKDPNPFNLPIKIGFYAD